MRTFPVGQDSKTQVVYGPQLGLDFMNALNKGNKEKALPILQSAVFAVTGEKYFINAGRIKDFIKDSKLIEKLEDYLLLRRGAMYERLRSLLNLIDSPGNQEVQKDPFNYAEEIRKRVLAKRRRNKSNGE